MKNMEKDLPLLNIELNRNLYITDSQEDESVIFVHDKYVDDNYWNYAYLKQPKLNLQKVKDFFHSKNLPASVYFLGTEDFSGVGEELLTNGFELSYTDATMVYEGRGTLQEQRFEIKEATTPALEKDFLRVYTKVFVDEGEDIYSGLSDGYLKNIEDYFRNYPNDRRFDIVAYQDDKPAGIASVVYNDKYALIMNVAVSPDYRRRGIAKDLSNKCISKFGDKRLFLSTEKDSVDEDIYQRMGFVTRASGKCYKEKEYEK